MDRLGSSLYLDQPWCLFYLFRFHSVTDLVQAVTASLPVHTDARGTGVLRRPKYSALDSCTPYLSPADMTNIRLAFSEPFRFFGCYFSFMACALVRLQLARCTAWFPPQDPPDKKTLSAPRSLVPPLRRIGFAVELAVWSICTLACNMQFIIDTVHSFRETLAPDASGVVHVQLVQVALVLSATVLVQPSLRTLYNVYNGMRAPTPTDSEEYHYWARVYMWDGIYMPLLLLAYGDVRSYAHAAQSIVWASFLTWSLCASHGFAEVQAAQRAVVPLETV